MHAISPRLQSIKLRLVFFAMLCAVPMFIFSVVQWRHEMREVHNDVIEDMDAGLSRLEARMRHQFSVAEVSAQLASAIDLSRPAAVARCNQAMTQSKLASGYVRSLDISDASGVLLCSSTASAAGVSIADRRYFREAKSSRQPQLSEFVRSRASGRPTFAVAVPLLAPDGEFRGVALTVFDAASLTKGISPNDQMTLALLDRNNALASFSEETASAELGRAVDVQKLDRVLRAAEPVELNWLGTKPRLYKSLPVFFHGVPVLRAVVGSDAAAMEATAFRHFAINAALMLLMSVGIALIAVTASHPLVLGRLRGLLSAAKEVSRGHYKARVYSKVDDELSKLEHAFNSMVDAVEADQLRLARNENHFRMLFEHNLDGVLAGRPSGEATGANKAACRILGYTEEEIIRLGRSAVCAVDADADKLRDLVMERALNGTARGELTLVRGDGTKVDVELASIICVDREGEPVTWTIIRDTTERARSRREIERLNADLEARVLERTKELAQANAEMAAFSSTVSHDLRAPVGVVRSFCQVLAERANLEGKNLDYLKRIGGAAERMDKLIEALLQLARLGRLQPEVQRVDLVRMTHEVARDCREATGRDVSLIVEAEGMVEGDPALLNVVLTNLLSNAWKFTGKKTDPFVSVEFDRSHDGWTTVTVRDNGAGFNEEHASRLFQPFERMHNPKDFAGIGIGLATVRRIVQKHGGRIWAHARLDAGAVFHFTVRSAAQGHARGVAKEPAPCAVTRA